MKINFIYLFLRLSDEIDELKNLPVRDADEEIFELREKYEHLHADWKIARSEHDALQREIDRRQSLMQKHEFEMQKQVETVAYLNNEVRFFFLLETQLFPLDAAGFFPIFWYIIETKDKRIIISR
jgi:hypothetical protein